MPAKHFERLLTAVVSQAEKSHCHPRPIVGTGNDKESDHDKVQQAIGREVDPCRSD